MLIISPTRELANQIAKEATALMTFHSHMKVMTVVGGTNKSTDVRNVASGTDILVATPGRLIDHLQNTRGFADRCRGTRFLILDEADQLLEMGFR